MSRYSFNAQSAPNSTIPVGFGKYLSAKVEIAFVDESFVNLAEGRMYVVDTTKDHSFFNGSEEERLHIVGVVQPTPRRL